MDVVKSSFYDTKMITFAIISILASGFLIVFGFCASLLFFGFQPQTVPILSSFLEAKSITFHVGCSGATEDTSACLAKAFDICGRQNKGAQTLYIKKIAFQAENGPVDVAFLCGADPGRSSASM
ncbi:hypothetical protein [Paraburkholderia sp. J11-2]|uniref:hypothetical protein n=1 Tax=Paraburkholderia sp. J11-2 TaxID=2805431 RepID=UPI002AB7E169|nr:hypothetical protein [Paraburkholderia sp. J11-2]